MILRNKYRNTRLQSKCLYQQMYAIFKYISIERMFLLRIHDRTKGIGKL